LFGIGPFLIRWHTMLTFATIIRTPSHFPLNAKLEHAITLDRRITLKKEKMFARKNVVQKIIQTGFIVKQKQYVYRF